MKYSLEASVLEIQKRRVERLRERKRRRAGALAGTTALLAALLLAAARQLPGIGAARAADSVYGAFLLSPAAGGYVLAGVIAFVAGIAVTALCLAHRGKQRRKRPQAPDPDQTERKKNEEA